ncbi:MAG: iron-containing redox enzyme family protein [Actinomycetota bacterium]|nr:iron-containing redox enzyme family protein [Actinomycetota bacterium]
MTGVRPPSSNEAVASFATFCARMLDTSGVGLSLPVAARTSDVRKRTVASVSNVVPLTLPPGRAARMGWGADHRSNGGDVVTTGLGVSSRSPMPAPCGALGSAVAELLGSAPTEVQAVLGDGERAIAALPHGAPLLEHLDAQRTWFLLAELDGRGVCGVDDGWNEHPAVATVRWYLGHALEAAIRDRIGPVEPCTAAQLPGRVRRELAEVESPPLSARLQATGTVEQYRDLLRHRSIYHLREADPHTTAIPRLTGRTKAALVEIQNDEYGGGRAEWMHSTLFARALSALDLSTDYAAYVGELPSITLAWSNALTLFASRRGLRAAIVGHLLALECTSSIPNKRYAQGLRRLGSGSDATAFFDEHVEADVVHEQIALYDMAVPLLEDQPELSVDLLTGFRAALVLDADVGRYLLRQWGIWPQSHGPPRAPSTPPRRRVPSQR